MAVPELTMPLVKRGAPAGLRRILLLSGMVVLAACAGWPVEKKYTAQDTTWIREGATTREEVVDHFGDPDLSMAIDDESGRGKYAEYHPDAPGKGFRQRFWVLYDKDGVVKSFGFGRPPQNIEQNIKP